MNGITQLLAETAGGGIDGGNFLTIGAGAIAAVGAAWALVVNAYKKGVVKGEAKRDVTITGQPVGVRLHDAFVTRTEFAEFKGEMKSDMREIKGMFDKALTLIAERDERLTSKIGEVASGAYEARRRIHETVNRQGERLAAMETKADISKGLATLGKAVMSRPCMHSNSKTNDDNGR